MDGYSRLNRQTAEAYALAFKKVFTRCSSLNPCFKPGSTLLGVLTDWSDAEINGLKNAVGKDIAEVLLKGCRVHWNRSCLRVADKVTRSNGEKEVFLKICYMIPKLTDAVQVVACFQALCGAQTLKELTSKVRLQVTQSEIDLIDKECDWSIAKNWAQWWSKYEHLTMLCKVFSSMDGEIWDRCPSTTNAVERKNKDCKTDNPSSLKLAMVKVYKLDKIAALRHIAATENISLSYRSRSDARLEEAQRKRKQRQKAISPDKSAQYGPPDRSSNFSQPSSSKVSSAAQPIVTKKRKEAPKHDQATPAKKRAVEVDKTVINLVHSCNPEMIGKRVKMLFTVEDEDEWYEGIIATYNILSGKYGIYFPTDNETVETSLEDDDLEFID